MQSFFPLFEVVLIIIWYKWFFPLFTLTENVSWICIQERTPKGLWWHSKVAYSNSNGSCLDRTERWNWNKARLVYVTKIYKLWYSCTVNMDILLCNYELFMYVLLFRYYKSFFVFGRHVRAARAWPLVAIEGHEPLLTSAVEWLLGSPTDPRLNSSSAWYPDWGEEEGIRFKKEKDFCKKKKR